MNGERRGGVVLVALLAAGLAALQTAGAQTVRTVGPVRISFYGSGQSDEDGAGSADWTTQQMDDVTACVATWANGIANTAVRQANLHLFWNALGSTILGETWDPLDGNGTTSWTPTERVWRDGVNYTGSASYDMRTAFSTGIPWNFGTASPPSGTYDFRSVMTHELGHPLGFDSSYNHSTGRFSSLGITAWDTYLIDSSGNRAAPGSRGTPQRFRSTSNPAYFTGPAAVAYYGGNVPVYAPSPWAAGSSLSHLDESRLPNALMSPQLADGQAVRAPTPLEWEIMKDLGWTVIGTKTWSKGAGTLNWIDAANWGPSGVPDQNWNVSFTTTGLSSGNVVDLGGDHVINTLTIGSIVSFTLGGETGTLSVNRANIVRTPASSGTQTIARPVVLGADALWDVSGAGQLRLSGPVTSAYSLSKIGPGMVVLAGPTNVADSMLLDDGDLTLGAGGSLTVSDISGDGSLNFDGGSLTLTGTSALHLRGVRVGKEGPGTFTLGAGKTMVTDVFLTIGRDSGGQGTFINQSGTVTCNTNLFVGVYAGSSGHFVQQTGPNPGDPPPVTTVAQATHVGDQGGTGLLEVKSGTFTTQDLQPGYGSSGTVTQTGGTVTVTGNLELAHAADGTYSLNGGTLVTGTFTQGTGAAAFNFGGGTLKAAAALGITMPLMLAGGGGIDTNGLAVTLTGGLIGTGTLVKTGAGTLSIEGPQTYGSPSALQVNGGAVVMKTDAGSATSAPMMVSVGAAGASATLNFNVSQHLAGLNLTGGGRANLLAGHDKVLLARALGIEEVAGSPTSRLDLADNAMIVDYDGPAASPLQDIKRWIASGCHGTAWDGNGIVSSSAAAQANTYGLGYAQNDLLYNPFSTFAGQAVDPTTILVKYTYLGDVNLDGKVDDNDVTIMVLNYDHGQVDTHTWQQGDISGYDGRIDDNDITVLVLNYHRGIGAPLGEATAVVPEPAGLSLLAAGLAALLFRRQRRIHP
jgi:autotransporter-associated beta strand protein